MDPVQATLAGPCAVPVHQLWVPEVGAVLQVVCCTLTGALGRHLEGEAGKFDVVFVDEAAQVSR